MPQAGRNNMDRTVDFLVHQAPPCFCAGIRRTTRASVASPALVVRGRALIGSGKMNCLCARPGHRWLAIGGFDLVLSRALLRQPVWAPVPHFLGTRFMRRGRECIHTLWDTRRSGGENLFRG